ncbi:hypothetical protein TcWFU_009655 [Taenia crassiceps]|uniref:Uncharacterized protein n=1 Tax=Taenia crassiceps TaxID=6207 RepID=A0ABR4Q7E8_9CEST
MSLGELGNTVTMPPPPSRGYGAHIALGGIEGGNREPRRTAVGRDQFRCYPAFIPTSTPSSPCPCLASPPRRLPSWITLVLLIAFGEGLPAGCRVGGMQQPQAGIQAAAIIADTHLAIEAERFTGDGDEWLIRKHIRHLSSAKARLVPSATATVSASTGPSHTVPTHKWLCDCEDSRRSSIAASPPSKAFFSSAGRFGGVQHEPVCDDLC